MAHMMILSSSGIRVQNIIYKGKRQNFLEYEQQKRTEVLQSYGVVHCNREWCIMLWNDSSQCAVMIDFEDISWSKEQLPLRSTSGNTMKRSHSYKRRHYITSQSLQRYFGLEIVSNYIKIMKDVIDIFVHNSIHDISRHRFLTTSWEPLNKGNQRGP